MRAFLFVFAAALVSLSVVSSVAPAQESTESRPAGSTPQSDNGHDLLDDAEKLGNDALESGEGAIEVVDANEDIRKAADEGLAGVEKLTDQDSPFWYFAVITLAAATSLSFSIQTLGGFLTIFKFGYLDVRELLSDVLAAAVSVICLSFALKSGDSLGVVVSSNSALIGSVSLAAVLGIAMGVWGVRQEFESCRTTKLMEELSETQTQYSRLKAKAQRMRDAGRKLLHEKKARRQSESS